MTTNLRAPRDYASANDFLRAADAAGVELPDEILRAVQAVEAAEEHRRKAAAAWIDLDPLTVTDGLAEELAASAIAGLPLDDGDVFERVDRADRERRTSQLRVEVANGIAERVWRHLSGAIMGRKDELIVERLRPVLAAIIGDVARLAGELGIQPGDGIVAEAVVADPKRAKAYAALHNVHRRYAALLGARRHLNGGQELPGDELAWLRNAPAVWRARGTEWGFRLQATRRPWPDDGFAQLIWSATATGPRPEPWIPTDDELEAAREEVAVRLQQRAELGVYGGS